MILRKFVIHITEFITKVLSFSSATVAPSQRRYLVSTLLIHKVLMIFLCPIKSSYWSKISIYRISSGRRFQSLDKIFRSSLLFLVQVPNRTLVLCLFRIRRSVHSGPLNQKVFIRDHMRIEFNQNCFRVVPYKSICWIQLCTARVPDDAPLNSLNSSKSELRSIWIVQDIAKGIIDMSVKVNGRILHLNNRRHDIFEFSSIFFWKYIPPKSPAGDNSNFIFRIFLWSYSELRAFNTRSIRFQWHVLRFECLYEPLFEVPLGVLSRCGSFHAQTIVVFIAQK